jgi:hypothetical protein
MDDRLPTHIEVSGLLRRVQSEGGFATVIQKGEREAGTILLILCDGGRNSRAYERMPQLDGTRTWHNSRVESDDNKAEFADYITRRGQQDRDLWIVELDIAHGERLIGLSPDSP